MTLGSIYSASSFFKYNTPTPIQGAPSNKSLKRLKTELRANASSVESKSGGGDHGYLGLALIDEEYESILPTPPPFIAPHFPGNLQLNPNTTQVEALALREEYKEATRKYYECKNIKKALQGHSHDIIEDKYLESLVNEDTQLIQADIPTVLAYLFEKNGTVPSAEVNKKENEIRSMTFHPADPMILLYNPMKKIAKMTVAAGIQYT